MHTLKIAWFGSSLVSAYWNGAATYYRGMVKALADLGHHIEFFEPDAFGRQAHRDLPDPPWARVTVYEPTEAAAARCLVQAARADVVVKSSGVGVLDAFLEREIVQLARRGRRTVFWDVDAPATLARLRRDPGDPLRALIPAFSRVLTYGGGPPVIAAYEALGARSCVPVYNALDPETHYPVPACPEFSAALGFLGNRLPDRDHRVERFFFEAVRRMPEHRFLLGGSGWEDRADLPPNLSVLGHVYTEDHNAFNSSPLAVLNLCRDSMAENGWSPATRVFEAAGAGACIISDDWAGIEDFLEPGREVLVAKDGADLVRVLAGLTPARARRIGAAARGRVLEAHTYARRAREVETLLLDDLYPDRAGRVANSAPRAGLAAAQGRV
jgi:spore maturation protein CgeB